MIDKVVKMALENMDKEYCRLSKMDYVAIEKLAGKKFLERPFAYEFYHQIRKLLDAGKIELGGCVIQGEVDKSYQHIFTEGKIPDFIIHVPDINKNLMVIEFKLANNPYGFKKDFDKLFEFKTNDQLKYDRAIEVVIGSKDELNIAREKISALSQENGEEITIAEFDTDIWKTNLIKIIYSKIS